MIAALSKFAYYKRQSVLGVALIRFICVHNCVCYECRMRLRLRRAFGGGFSEFSHEREHCFESAADSQVVTLTLTLTPNP
jgi:hypothetical protein